MEAENTDIINLEDGAVIKKLITQGTGFDHPIKGSKCKVHYTGRLLDGSVFDSSVERGEPFEFELKANQVIKGWDVAVESMVKGEKAEFTIKPEYAYGKSGSPPKIPADATLKFEIELLSFTSEKDVSKNKDEGVMKKILKEGEGWETPNEEAKVKLHFTLSLPDGTVVENTKTTHPNGYEFVVGEGQQLQGLEDGVSSMKKNEVATLTVQPRYGFGEAGSPDKKVPPNSVLKYEVELLDITKPKGSWEMSVDEKLEACQARKEQGNTYFKEKKYELAGRKYKKALSFVEYDSSVPDDKKPLFKQAKLLVFLNLAATKKQLEDWKGVLENTKKALEIEPHNVKALFRAAQAHHGLREFDLAEKELLTALEKEPENAEVKRELAVVRKAIKEQDQKDKKIYAKIFQALSHDEPSTPAPSKPAEGGA